MKTVPAAQPSVTDRATQRVTRARHGLAVSLFFITAINYLDRTNMAVALPHITDDLNLSPTQAGLILSAFAWSYALLQIPGGWLVDRFGPKLSFGYAMVGWSLVTIAVMLSRGFGVLLGMRLVLGVAEAPAFPANNRLVAAWFPPRERARATAVYTAGEYVGLAVAVPLLSWVVATTSWHMIFLWTGLLGLAFSVLWFRRVYDTPHTSPRVNEAELAHIEGEEDAARQSGTTESGTKATTWSDLGFLLRRRRLWGMYIGQFANTSVLYFFLTWFPTYLVEEKGMSTIKSGVLGSIPYLAALGGVLLGGAWSDWLLRTGKAGTIARKTPIMTGFALAGIIVAANFTTSVPLVILFMSIAFFAQGMMALGWTLVADVAPVRLLGLTGGVFNFISNVGGALTPIVVGVIYQSTGSFAPALVYIGALAVLGLFAYLVLIDKVERLTI
ncbi:MFS transporter [Streptomyces sp. NPDC058247]|uniref:MFS transporter n=1 Tax=Streptomyces sp. NPDC058247 TaxID=3346401 RepID=UPI0036E044DC